jgi:hypothetical protein
MEMALYQVGDQLEAKDNRCKGVQREYDALPDNPFLTAFYERYAQVFHMTSCRASASSFEGGSEGPTEPLVSHEQEQEQEQAQEQDFTPSGSSAEPTGKDRLPPCPLQALVDTYHEKLPDLPRVRLMTSDRERALKKTWKWVLTSTRSDGGKRASTSAEAVAWFADYFSRALDNDFLMGRTARSAGHENWKCDLDYLLTDRGMKQVIEKTEVAA